MMNHGGPPTAALKRWLAMQAEAAEQKAQALSKPTAPHMALLPSVYNSPSSASTSPRANAADEQPLIPDGGDIEMADSLPNYSHSHAQPAFSPVVPPFVPPGANTHTTVTMAAPPRRPPPHRPALTQAPTTSAPGIPSSVSPGPMIKQEPSASPSPSVRSTVRPAPHVKRGPHAPKAPVAPHMQPPAPVAVPGPSTVSAHDVLIDFESPKSDHNAIKVQESPQAQNSPWADLQGLQVKTEPESTNTEHLPTHVDTDPKLRATEAVPTMEYPTASVVAAAALSGETLVEPPAVVNLHKISNGTRRFGRNQWLPLLLSMGDTDKGRQLIRAFADHIRAGVDNLGTGDSTASTDQELFMEFPDGQCYPATVPHDTAISDIIKEFADMIKAKESDISVMLKLRVEDQID